MQKEEMRLNKSELRTPPRGVKNVMRVNLNLIALHRQIIALH